MKVIEYDNYRVEVPLDRFWEDIYQDKHSYLLSLGKDVVSSIKRHVDGIDTREIQFLFDTKERCSFCGYKWETDNDGCPMCCDAAVREWREK